MFVNVERVFKTMFSVVDSFVYFDLLQCDKCHIRTTHAIHQSKRKQQKKILFFVLLFKIENSWYRQWTIVHRKHQASCKKKNHCVNWIVHFVEYVCFIHSFNAWNEKRRRRRRMLCYVMSHMVYVIWWYMFVCHYDKFHVLETIQNRHYVNLLA